MSARVRSCRAHQRGLNSVYHVRQGANGKRFSRSNKKTQQAGARAKGNKIVAPFLAQDEADIPAHTAGSVKSGDDRAMLV